MKRRNFLIYTSIAFSSSIVVFSKSLPKNEALLLENVYEILFPKTQTMPSAKEFGVISYFSSNFYTQYFPKEDREYILQGARDFIQSFPEFMDQSNESKIAIIKTASNNDYGYSWLSTLIYYGYEAMLSHPIYGGNQNAIAYKALNHKPGQPEPKSTYGAKL